MSRVSGKPVQIIGSIIPSFPDSYGKIRFPEQGMKSNTHLKTEANTFVSFNRSHAQSNTFPSVLELAPAKFFGKGLNV